MVRAGTFALVERKGYEDILERLNVGVLRRNAALAADAAMEISESDGQWKIELKTSRTSNVINFKIGAPFEHITGSFDDFFY